MKTPATDNAAGQGGADVFALLAKRAAIEQWIARLDSQRGSVSEKIIKRVRADYESRLGETLQALGSHRTAVEDQLLSESDRLSIAEATHADAQEQLEEGRLRNIIGELSDEEWSAEKGTLEQDVAAAASRANELRAEVERLSELMTQLNEEDGRSVAIAAGDDVDPAEAAPVHLVVAEQAEIATVAASRLEPSFEDGGGVSGPSGGVHGSSDPEEDPFLASIDRALSASPEADVQPSLVGGDDETVEDTAPKPGLKCGECGYTNDLSAWFCGVCGADVG